MKILSFDVGVTSLSMVIFTVPEKDVVNPKVKRQTKKVKPTKTLSSKTSNSVDSATAEPPIYNFNIVHWECIDLVAENCAYQEYNKKGECKTINSKQIDLCDKNYYVIESLNRRQHLWSDFTAEDYILIENQLLTMSHGVKMGSADNKVLSYTIRNYFYLYFLSCAAQKTASSLPGSVQDKSSTATVVNKIPNPSSSSTKTSAIKTKPSSVAQPVTSNIVLCDHLAVAQKGNQSSLALMQRRQLGVLPTMDFVNPSLKLKRFLLQKFCGNESIELIANTDVNEKRTMTTATRTTAQQKTGRPLKKTKKQKFIAQNSIDYKQHKNLSVGYTEQILKLANQVSVHSTAATGCTLFSKRPTTSSSSSSNSNSKELKTSKNLTYWCTLYNDFVPGERKSNHSGPGWKFHHTVIPKADGKNENKNRRSDLGDCLLQALAYYILKIAKFKFPKIAKPNSDDASDEHEDENNEDENNEDETIEAIADDNDDIGNDDGTE